MSYADKWTDKQLESLEKRIAEVYSEAQKDLEKTAKDYFDKFAERDEKELARLKNGEITKQQYQQWRLAQMGRGERFNKLASEMAHRATATNEVAVAYVNDITPSIYTLNYNHEAYMIEKLGFDMKVGEEFTLINEQTVKRMIVNNPDVMPYYPPARAVKRGIDLEYGQKYIKKHVTSGILQGKGVGKIADDLQRDLTNMNRASALRTARTAVTSAQNGGRQATMERAVEMGIPIQKKWKCVHDIRTRPEHAAADGQIVPVGEPFIVGGEKLMHPGDTSGSGWNIYNCRCVEGSVEKEGIVAEKRQMRVRNPETGENELVSEMTYEEWAKAHGLTKGKPQEEKANTDPYSGLTVEQKKDLISANSEKMLQLSKDKDQATLNLLTASSNEETEKFFNEAKAIQKQLDDLAAENKIIQKQIDEMNAEAEKAKFAALKERAKNHHSVNGSDISGKIDYSNTIAGLDIETAIHTQGFDGVPKVVEYDEFVEAMNKSNFYAERTYSASSKEILDAYQDELYSGKWYVDCSEGGSQYGKGMYCAASYDITDTKSMGGIGWEMSHYQTIGIEKGNSFSYTEAITLQPDARIFELPYNSKADEYIWEEYRNNYLLTHSKGSEHNAVKKYVELSKKRNIEIGQMSYEEAEEIAAALTEAKDNISSELFEEAIESTKYYPEGSKYGKLKDAGTLATEMGYDAINAVGHGESGSYTVILNRTKVIFCKGGSIYGN